MNQNKTDKTAGDDGEFPAYFHPELIGKELREVAVDFLQVDAETVQSRWFHCAKDADLFLWSNDRGHLIKAQVTFCGHVVEWNILDGVKTGVTVEDEIEPHEIKSKVKSSEMIVFDSQPHALALETAIRMVGEIPGLEGELKADVIRSINGEAGRLLGRLTTFPSRRSTKAHLPGAFSRALKSVAQWLSHLWNGNL